MEQYRNIKLADPIQLTTVSQSFYTVPTAERIIATVFSFANTNSSASVSISMHLCPADAAPDDSNVIIPNTPVDPLSVVNFNFGQVLNAADVIKAYASDVGITMHGSGILII